MIARVADVRDRAALAAAVSDGVRAFGRLDIVSANAGISPPGAPLWKLSPEEWDDVIGVNLTGVFNTLAVMLHNEATYRQFRADLEHPTLEDTRESMASLNLLPVAYIDPADVSEAVLWLASDLSRYVTGVALPVDAGSSLK